MSLNKWTVALKMGQKIEWHLLGSGSKRQNESAENVETTVPKYSPRVNVKILVKNLDILLCHANKYMIFDKLKQKDFHT